MKNQYTLKYHIVSVFGCECSDLGVGGWVSCNLNVVRICKSVRNIGRSLKYFWIMGLWENQFLMTDEIICQIRLHGFDGKTSVRLPGKC